MKHQSAIWACIVLLVIYCVIDTATDQRALNRIEALEGPWQTAEVKIQPAFAKATPANDVMDLPPTYEITPEQFRSNQINAVLFGFICAKDGFGWVDTSNMWITPAYRALTNIDAEKLK